MTPDDKIGLLLVILLPLALFVGWCLATWRQTNLCCHCCTCENCRQSDDGFEEWRDEPLPYLATVAGIDSETLAERRHTVMLEPGPTIYLALAALAQDPADGSQDHADATESLWLDRVRLDLWQRYPIPGEAA